MCLWSMRCMCVLSYSPLLFQPVLKLSFGYVGEGAVPAAQKMKSDG
jgi:hypothetical protein